MCAPTTKVDDYMIGRVLGKGAYGKVNLALQKLSLKVCAVKSINKDIIKTENDLLRITTERFMVEQAKLRHPNIV